jgi:hypothetical protein
VLGSKQGKAMASGFVLPFWSTRTCDGLLKCSGTILISIVGVNVWRVEMFKLDRNLRIES